MLKRLICKTYRNQKGITGLETAIILIAFVVVAAVFAYTVLSAGLFSSQKSSEAVYAGLKETQSTLELKGGVVAYADQRTTLTGNDYNLNAAGTGVPTSSSDSLVISKVEFTVACALNGEPMDLTPPFTSATLTASTTTPSQTSSTYRTLISYSDQNQFIEDCAWTLTFVGSHTDDYILEDNEKAVITVWLLWDDADFTGYALGGSASDPFMDSVANCVGTDHTFMIEVKPEKGAVLPIERTTPGYLDTTNDLH